MSALNAEQIAAVWEEHSPAAFEKDKAQAVR